MAGRSYAESDTFDASFRKCSVNFHDLIEREALICLNENCTVVVLVLALLPRVS